MLGEAGEHVAHALLQGVELRVDQDLHHQALGGELDEALPGLELLARRSALLKQVQLTV